MGLCLSVPAPLDNNGCHRNEDKISESGHYSGNHYDGNQEIDDNGSRIMVAALSLTLITNDNADNEGGKKPYTDGCSTMVL